MMDGDIDEELAQEPRNPECQTNERVVREPGDSLEDSLVEQDDLHQVKVADWEEAVVATVSNDSAEHEDGIEIAGEPADIVEEQAEQRESHGGSPAVVGRHVEVECGANETSCNDQQVT